MRERKISLRHFHYRECDAFAKYLEKQAAKGWHFKEWRLGLVFEKGEPRKVKYSVEVFPKGDERDSRPEKDAEEFAEYCRAAGWELVDGWKKFCVFKSIREDTVPITEAEVRYENICKAEKERLYMFCVFVPGAAFFLLNMWEDLYRVAFRNSYLFCLISILLMAVCSIADVLTALLWRRKRKRQLAIGETPFYGKTIGVHYYAFIYIWVAGIIILQVMELVNRGIYDISSSLIFYISTIIMGIVAFIAAIFKLSGKQRGLIHGIMIFAGIFGVGGLGIYSSLHIEPEVVSEKEAPLMSEDFKEVSGEPYIYSNESESILGKNYEYYISYGDTEPDSTIYEQMRYMICESPYAWVRNHLWKQRADWGKIWRNDDFGEEGLPETTDCKALWGAEEAWEYLPDEHYAEKYCYEVRYPDKLIVLRTMEALDEEDVQIIREKLKLD